MPRAARAPSSAESVGGERVDRVAQQELGLASRPCGRANSPSTILTFERDIVSCIPTDSTAESAHRSASSTWPCASTSSASVRCASTIFPRPGARGASERSRGRASRRARARRRARPRRPRVAASGRVRRGADLVEQLVRARGTQAAASSKRPSPKRDRPAAPRHPCRRAERLPLDSSARAAARRARSRRLRELEPRHVRPASSTSSAGSRGRRGLPRGSRAPHSCTRSTLSRSPPHQPTLDSRSEPPPARRPARRRGARAPRRPSVRAWTTSAFRLRAISASGVSARPSIVAIPGLFGQQRTSSISTAAAGAPIAARPPGPRRSAARASAGARARGARSRRAVRFASRASARQPARSSAAAASAQVGRYRPSSSAASAAARSRWWAASRRARRRRARSHPAKARWSRARSRLRQAARTRRRGSGHGGSGNAISPETVESGSRVRSCRSTRSVSAVSTSSAGSSSGSPRARTRGRRARRARTTDFEPGGRRSIRAAISACTVSGMRTAAPSPPLDEQPHGLLDEQRVALGLVEQCLPTSRGEAEPRLDERVDEHPRLVVGSGPSSIVIDAPPASAPAGPSIEQLGPREADDQHRRVVDPVGEVLDEVEQSALPPSGILEAEHERLGLREAHVAHSCAAQEISWPRPPPETVSSTPDASPSRSATASLEQPRAASRTPPRASRRRRSPRPPAPSRPEAGTRVPPRTGRRAAGEHGRALEPGEELPREAALPDARIAEDGDELRSTVADRPGVARSRADRAPRRGRRTARRR